MPLKTLNPWFLPLKKAQFALKGDGRSWSKKGLLVKGSEGGFLHGWREPTRVKSPSVPLYKRGKTTTTVVSAISILNANRAFEFVSSADAGVM
jgi:hypothetical protein